MVMRRPANAPPPVSHVSHGRGLTGQGFYDNTKGR